MKKQQKEKITAFLIVYNEEEIIERALKSIKGVVDEILVIHDGPCKDNTLKIAKKYTKKIFTPPHEGRAALHLIFALKKAKNDWLFKLDADEVLSAELRKNLGKLTKNKKVSAYTFKWLLWDGKKYATKNWPHKKSMFRKSKCSFMQLPGWDEPRTKGRTVQTNYLLEHKPLYGVNEAFLPHKKLWKRSVKRGKDQAEYTLRDFEEIEKYKYDKDGFPLAIKIRRAFPLLSAPAFAFVAFFKEIFSEGAWKEGFVIYRGALKTAFSYLWLGNYISKLKKKKW